MQEVAGQNPHLQPGLVGFEALADGLSPAQGILPFLDPVFYLGPAVIDLDHLAARGLGVGHHKANAGEKLFPHAKKRARASAETQALLGGVMKLY